MAPSHYPDFTGANFTPTLHEEVPEVRLPANQPLPSPFVVLVTGSSRGLGAATAQVFAEAGASGIILTARDAKNLTETRDACLKAAKNPNLKITCLSSEASADESVAIALAEAIQKEHGRLDLFIANAGILSTDASAFGPLADMKASQITIPTETNYIARALQTKHLIPLLLASPNGAKTIVNVTSIGSTFVGMGAIGFSISAFANNRLAEWTAAQYGEQGILSYAVHPGTVKTTPPEGFPKHILELSTDSPRLLGTFALWLVSERPKWLSGRYLCATWDTEELKGREKEVVEGDKLKMRLAL